MSKSFKQTIVIILVFFAGIYIGQQMANKDIEEQIKEAYEDGINEGFERCSKFYVSNTR